MPRHGLSPLGHSIANTTNVQLELNKHLSSYVEKVEYLRTMFPKIIIPNDYIEVSELTIEEQYNLLLSLSEYGVNTAESLGENGFTSVH